jgi:1-acyl-sn-glycerol-3-phosphate acyltransferase
VTLLAEADVRGIQDFPRRGPALIVVNHLGDGDAALLLAALPVAPEVLGKIELLEFPLLGVLMEWYGIIWLKRGLPDRPALQGALHALEQGRFVILAPEGRYSLTGALEKAHNGAAWLARNANVPIVPVALTGTRNVSMYSNLRRFRRPRLTLTVGAPFQLEGTLLQPRALQHATRQIMNSLARLLPSEYRGVYGGPPAARGPR